jgi:O-antigen/teichoic acid export membrane protein
MVRLRQIARDAAVQRLGLMTAAFAGSDAVRAALGFSMAIAVARALGTDGFGRWTLCVAWASTLTAMSDLGFGQLLTREAARPDARTGPLLASAIATRLAAFCPAALLVFLTAHRLAGAESVDALRVGLLVSGFGIVYGCFAAVLRAAPRSLTAVVALDTVALAAQFGLVVAIVRRDGTIAALMAAAAAVQLVQLAMGAFVWRLSARRDDALIVPSVSQAWAAVRRAVPFAAAGLVANAQARLPAIALGVASPAGEIAAFGAAWKLGNAARRVPHALFGAALPVLAHEHGRTGERSDALHRTLNAFVALFAASAAIALVIAPSAIVRLAYGSAFVTAAPAARWIGLALVPLLVNASRRVYLCARGDERVALRWSTIALAVQAAVTIALIGAFGAAAAAASVAIGEALVVLPLQRAVRRRAASASALDAQEPVESNARLIPQPRDV